MARFVALSGSPETVSDILTPLAHAVLGLRSEYGILEWFQPGRMRVVVVSGSERTTLARHPALPCLVAADARLDNLSALVQRCGMPPNTPVPAAILAAYLRFGSGFESELEGEFSFAIWDGRNRSWHCGRDRFGVKPIYYTSGAGSFACASAPAGLSRLPWTSNAPNLQMGLGYLAGVCVDEHASFYEGVRRIPPAQSLVHDRGRDKLSRYWRLDPERSLERGNDNFAEQWLTLFRQAVRRRSLDAAPSAVALSGGLDSSIVYGALNELGEATPLAFSAVFDQVSLLDERPFARAVTRKRSEALHWTHPERITSGEHVQTALDVLEEPYLLDFYQITWSVFEAAAGKGTHTLWTGYCGDSVVSYGWGWTGDMARSLRLLALYRELRFSKTVPRALQTLLRSVLSALQPECLRRVRSAFRARMGRFRREHAFCLTSAGERAIGLTELLYDTWRNSARHRTSREFHVAALEYPTSDCAFLGTERIGHRYGIETAHPFMDRSLVEFSVALPVEEKRQSGYLRHILREAGRELLPALVRERKSKAIFTPYLDWAFTRCFDMAELNRIHGRHIALRDHLAPPNRFTSGLAYPVRGTVDLSPFVRWCHAIYLTWYDRVTSRQPTPQPLPSVLQGRNSDGL